MGTTNKGLARRAEIRAHSQKKKPNRVPKCPQQLKMSLTVDMLIQTCANAEPSRLPAALALARYLCHKKAAVRSTAQRRRRAVDATNGKKKGPSANPCRPCGLHACASATTHVPRFGTALMCQRLSPISAFRLTKLLVSAKNSRGDPDCYDLHTRLTCMNSNVTICAPRLGHGLHTGTSTCVARAPLVKPDGVLTMVMRCICGNMLHNGNAHACQQKQLCLHREIHDDRQLYWIQKALGQHA